MKNNCFLRFAAVVVLVAGLFPQVAQPLQEGEEECSVHWTGRENMSNEELKAWGDCTSAWYKECSDKGKKVITKVTDHGDHKDIAVMGCGSDIPE